MRWSRRGKNDSVLLTRKRPVQPEQDHRSANLVSRMEVAVEQLETMTARLEGGLEVLREVLGRGEEPTGGWPGAEGVPGVPGRDP